MMSIKQRKRRVINIARKFHVDLSAGIFKVYVKKKVGIAPRPEFQVDLAKATVMYDDKRIVLVLKAANEYHSLIPIDDTLDHWRDAILKHRLYRQEAVSKGWQPDSNNALELNTQSDEKVWEGQPYNKVFHEVHREYFTNLYTMKNPDSEYEKMLWKKMKLLGVHNKEMNADAKNAFWKPAQEYRVDSFKYKISLWGENRRHDMNTFYLLSYTRRKHKNSLALEDDKVLEKVAKTYEEMQKTTEELKNSLKMIQEALGRPSTTTEAKSDSTASITTTPLTSSNEPAATQSKGTSVVTKSAPQTTITAETTTASDLRTDSKPHEPPDSEEEDTKEQPKSAVQMNNKA